MNKNVIARYEAISSGQSVDHSYTTCSLGIASYLAMTMCKKVCHPELVEGSCGEACPPRFDKLSMTPIFFSKKPMPTFII